MPDNGATGGQERILNQAGAPKGSAERAEAGLRGEYGEGGEGSRSGQDSAGRALRTRLGIEGLATSTERIDIFANNPLTETPAKSKGTHEQTTKPTTSAKPRRNKPAIGDNYAELFLDGL